jgi:hypothetical protein
MDTIEIERFVDVAAAREYICPLCTGMLSYPCIVKVKYERVPKLKHLKTSTPLEKTKQAIGSARPALKSG